MTRIDDDLPEWNPETVTKALKAWTKKHGLKTFNKLDKMKDPDLAYILTIAIFRDHYLNDGKNAKCVLRVLKNPKNPEAIAELMYNLSPKAALKAMHEIDAELKVN